MACPCVSCSKRLANALAIFTLARRPLFVTRAPLDEEGMGVYNDHVLSLATTNHDTEGNLALLMTSEQRI